MAPHGFIHTLSPNAHQQQPKGAQVLLEVTLKLHFFSQPMLV